MITQDEVVDVLREVYDPELHYNIYDLGLVYDIDVQDPGDVSILMTLTTPMCPIGPMVTEQIKEMLDLMPGVRDIEVEFTFNPAWTPEMMTDEARADLGLD
ncbi:MAG: iron-sulfur cluster assembly protein [Dehalococcoidia bacterium]